MEGSNIFVDSNVFVGVFNKDDALHKRAITLWGFLEKEQYRIVVSNFTISEVITVLSQRVDKETALEFAATMYGNERSEVEIIYSDERIEIRALDYLKSIPSKNVSFVDATIFAIIDLYQIRKLASFDKIFQRQRGIEIFT